MHLSLRDFGSVPLSRLVASNINPDPLHFAPQARSQKATQETDPKGLGHATWDFVNALQCSVLQSVLQSKRDDSARETAYACSHAERSRKGASQQFPLPEEHVHTYQEQNSLFSRLTRNLRLPIGFVSKQQPAPTTTTQSRLGPSDDGRESMSDAGVFGTRRVQHHPGA